jgi:aminopeptidase N
MKSTTSSPSRTSVAALACLVTFALAAVTPAGARSDAPDFDRALDAEVAELIMKGERRDVSRLVFARAAEADTSGYDVLGYTVRMNVNFSRRRISAETTIDVAATVDGLRTVDLDFVGMTVSEVRVDGQEATYERADGVLSVALPSPAAAGDEHSIAVVYAGRPKTKNDGGARLGLSFTAHGAATFVEPDGARYWFPCKDRPSDKASFEAFVTVPRKMVVASNGRLVETTSSGKKKTYHWLETHPIATYLISVAIARYEIIEDRAGDVPIVHYVYPEVAPEAGVTFGRTAPMLRAFEQRLGVEYPFDKYGHALFDNFGGGMEHQSCSSIGSNLTFGDDRYDRLVAHELGHQWFGDYVSPAGWEEIWLNEGFATWTEFLWTEHATPGTLPALLASREDLYFQHESAVGRYALYAPSDGRLFGTTIYQKGGWVVAMLRDLLGDEAFFEGLRAYLVENAYGTGTTERLQAAMEEASGRDLDAFFAEWVYGVGYPAYTYSWTGQSSQGGGYTVDLRVRQTQRGPTVFTHPLEVEATFADGRRVRQLVDVASADQRASLQLDEQPVRLSVDPDNKVLGTVSAAN